MSTSKKCYSELIRLPTFEERLRYLKTSQSIGDRTFGGSRYHNQAFYNSIEWKQFRHQIIVRDGGCDLGVPGYEIQNGSIHHIIPITIDDLMHGDDCLLDPENVILCSFKTHNAIHFGGNSPVYDAINVRRPGDTCPWR